MTSCNSCQKKFYWYSCNVSNRYPSKNFIYILYMPMTCVRKNSGCPSQPDGQYSRSSCIRFHSSLFAWYRFGGIFNYGTHCFGNKTFHPARWFYPITVSGCWPRCLTPESCRFHSLKSEIKKIDRFCLCFVFNLVIFRTGIPLPLSLSFFLT